MNIQKTKIACLISGILSIITANSQTTTIDYLASGLSTTACNVFNPSVTINGVVHSALAGGVSFNTTNGINLSTTPQSPTPGGTAYYMSYIFSPGNNYDISITAKGNSAILLNTSVVPNLNQFPTNGTNVCTPDPHVSSYQLVGVGRFNTATSTTSTTYNIPQFNTGTSTYTTLVIWSSGGQPGLSLDAFSISKVVIKQTSTVSFTLSPNVNMVCGSATPQTFTITNVNNTPGVTNYTWNIGATPNGWLFNGNPAPATLSTGVTNTLALTPGCGKALTTISATVTANGVNYNTNSNTVSVTQPAMSINGLASFCSGTSNYTLSGQACNATNTWTVTPSGIASFAPATGSSTTLTKTGNGSVTLAASVVSCGVTVPLTKIIAIGTAQPQSINFDNGPCPEYTVSTSSDFCTGRCSNYTWMFRNLTNNSPMQTFPNSSWARRLILNQGPGTYFVGVQVTNACGLGPVFSITRSIPCSIMHLKVSPNPVTESVSIEATGSDAITQIRVIDKMGQVKKELTNAPSKKVTLNVSDLPADVFRIQVLINNKWETVSFIKK